MRLYSILHLQHPRVPSRRWLPCSRHSSEAIVLLFKGQTPISTGSRTWRKDRHLCKVWRLIFMHSQDLTESSHSSSSDSSSHSSDSKNRPPSGPLSGMALASCHCIRDRSEPAWCTAPTLLQNSLPQRRRHAHAVSVDGLSISSNDNVACFNHLLMKAGLPQYQGILHKNFVCFFPDPGKSLDLARFELCSHRCLLLA